MAVKRVWHGWTSRERADEYQQLLHEVILPGIEAKEIPGYIGIEVLRKELESEVEFVTIMTFESVQSVIDFQGIDYRKSYVPPAAQEILEHWDRTARHYQVVETRDSRADGISLPFFQGTPG